MALTQQKTFKYPAEDECLVRRLGVGLMHVWPSLAPEVREKILEEAHIAWDREFYVSHLDDKLESLIKRYNARTRD